MGFIVIFIVIAADKLTPFCSHLVGVWQSWRALAKVERTLEVFAEVQWAPLDPVPVPGVIVKVVNGVKAKVSYTWHNPPHPPRPPPPPPLLLLPLLLRWH